MTTVFTAPIRSATPLSESRYGITVCLYGIVTLIAAKSLASIAEKINLAAKQEDIENLKLYINNFNKEFDLFILATDKWKKGLIDD